MCANVNGLYLCVNMSVSVSVNVSQCECEHKWVCSGTLLRAMRSFQKSLIESAQRDRLSFHQGFLHKHI